MMKQKVLAVVVPVLLGLSSAQAAEIYNKDGNKLDFSGRVNANHTFSNDKTNGNDGDQTYIRLGFKGQTQITDKLTGYGSWQYQFQGNVSEASGSNSGDKTRYGFAGLKYANLGSFDYGRNYGLVYDAIAATDMLPKFGGDSSTVDGFLTGRSTGVATYRNTDFFGLVEGLDFALQYEGKNDRGDTDAGIRRSNGDGYAFSVAYEVITGLTFTGAYANLDRTESQNTADFGKGDRAESWATSVKYDANQIYVAALYGETRNATPVTNNLTGDAGFANKTENFEVIAQYQFLNGIRPSIAYVQSKAKDVEGIGSVELYKYTSFGANYALNKNLNVYAEYKINLLDSDNALGKANDDVTGVGINYQF